MRAQIGIRHVGFKVDDVDAHVERLRQAGVPIAVEPFDTMADVRIAFFPDPDGAQLEFVTGAHAYHRLHSAELAAAEAQRLPKPGDPPRFDRVALTVEDSTGRSPIAAASSAWTENPWTPDPARLGFRAIGLADGTKLDVAR